MAPQRRGPLKNSGRRVIDELWRPTRAKHFYCKCFAPTCPGRDWTRTSTDERGHFYVHSNCGNGLELQRRSRIAAEQGRSMSMVRLVSIRSLKEGACHAHLLDQRGDGGVLQREGRSIHHKDPRKAAKRESGLDTKPGKASGFYSTSVNGGCFASTGMVRFANTPYELDMFLRI